MNSEFSRRHFARPLISHSQRRGALLVLVALSMAGLMGMLVLAIDVGMLHRKKRIAQMAADAAAKAGAIEILRERTGNIQTTAIAEATRNGFTSNGGNHKAVIVTWPSPGPSPFIGDYFVKVEVRDTAQSIFARIVGRSTVTVPAVSWGGVTGGAPTCILALEPHELDALKVESSGELVATNCNVAVNSDHPTDAMCVTTSSGTYLTAPEISVAGYNDGCSGTINGTVKENQTPALDQLLSVVPLLADTLSNSFASCDGGVYDEGLNKYDANVTLNPSIGVNGTNKAFCGGISIAKGGATMTLNPGIYVIRGGGFNVSGANLYAHGVTIVNLNPPPPTKLNKFEPINIAGSGYIDITAMTTGTFAGIAFYTPRAQGDSTDELNRFHSSAAAKIVGTIYIPDQQLYIGSGNSGVCPNTCMDITGGITARTINIGPDAHVEVKGSAGGSPGGVRRASLVR